VSAAPPQDTQRFPAVEMPITLTKLVVAAGGCRDMSPLHHDPDFARAAGHRTAFASTNFQQALVERAVRDWLGADVPMIELDIAMQRPIYLGTVARVEGAVDASVSGPGADETTLVITISTEDGVCTSSRVVVGTRAREA